MNLSFTIKKKKKMVMVMNLRKNGYKHKQYETLYFYNTPLKGLYCI